MLGDLFRGTAIGGLAFFVGAALVLGGFVAVGIADAQGEAEIIEAANVEGVVYSRAAARRLSEESLRSAA